MTDAEAGIREMFDTYLDCYNRLDARGLTALHAHPSHIIHRGEILVLTEDTNLPYHEKILAENAAAGEHVWELADMVLDEVAPNGAIAHLHWIARRPDGSLLWEDHPAYMVARNDDGWIILGNISSNAY